MEFHGRKHMKKCDKSIYMPENTQKYMINVITWQKTQENVINVIMWQKTHKKM